MYIYILQLNLGQSDLVAISDFVDEPKMARKMLPSMLLALSASPAAAATPRNILMITVDGASAPAPAAARERSSCALRDCAPPTATHPTVSSGTWQTSGRS